MENLSTITCGTFLEELASSADTWRRCGFGTLRGCCGCAYGHACQFNCGQSRQRRK